MLSKEHRLPARTKLSRPLFFKTPLFAVKTGKNGTSQSRFAFLVRKSVDKRAVVRNRIRRVFRSCIEELLEKISPGYDMLFFLEKGIMDERQENLCKYLKGFLKEKGLLR